MFSTKEFTLVKTNSQKGGLKILYVHNLKMVISHHGVLEGNCMRKLPNIVVTTLIILLSVISTDCSSNKNKKSSEEDKKYDFTYDDIVWKDYNRIIGLTSAKYNIQDSIAKGIILDYLRINQPVEYDVLTQKWNNRDTTVDQNILKPKETINRTINRLVEKYKIRKDSISSLLLDFELWYNTNK